MNKPISLLLVAVMLLTILSSFNKHKKNVVDYPKIYTPEYCSENYIQADPNLIHLVSADNDIGQIDVPGGSARYYAIKDVPLDEYLLLDEAIMFAPLSFQIVKNRNKDLPMQEVLSYEVKSLQLYSNLGDCKDKKNLGTEKVYEYIALLESDSATVFQSHILECLETKNYKENEMGVPYDFVYYNDSAISIRVTFSKYKNLVWDALIIELESEYFMYFYWFTIDEKHPDGYYDIIFIPLNEEIAELIP